MVVRVNAWAKVNLFLHVTGRRADGYHLLDSLVVFAGIGDTITVAPAEELRLSLDGPTALVLAAEPDNIVLKAARALAAAAAVPAHAHIQLTKRLPVAAGIGGGSTDAAATLLALARLWRIELPASAWQQLALGLGADVPVCLRRRPTQMSGIGDILDDVPPLPPAWLVLVNPMIGLATPAVFKARHGAFSTAAPLRQPPNTAQALAEALAGRHNDLSHAAIALVPDIAEVLAQLESQPGCLLARMSGSGATCFGLFADQDSADRAVAALAAHAPAWWSKSAPLLSAS